ncbi:MAG: DUF2889 domain-containing protein [Candidatus Lambdaproteobacteria bacterium]|nr:DUF2889 domain-containing protein [Candidatus Lambdaproteobacteria bacterium]
MPLPTPAPRELIHDRRVHCRAYLRKDGLWDIEGHIVDTKTYSFEMGSRGHIEAGAPIHDMWIRVTCNEALEIVDVETSMDARPYNTCTEILPNFKQLAGVQMGRGFHRKVRELLGGTAGCTHLLELLGPVATTAFQGIGSMQYRRRRLAGLPQPRTRPRNLDTCRSWASDGEVVRRNYPEFYTGPEPVERPPAAPVPPLEPPRDPFG